MSTRILVADDTVVFRRLIADALAGVPGVEVVGTAPNGKLALARMAELRPDMMTLDIEMPEMNGIEVLQAMQQSGLKAGVIMISSLTVRGGELTVRALELGAFDFLAKPQKGTREENAALLRDRLLPMVRAFERRHQIQALLQGKVSQPVTPPISTAAPAARRAGPPLVLIGVSTGGPPALAKLVPALPADLPAPVFIVQHMPSPFTRSLAASLASKSALAVKEAEEGEHARAGCVYIAPGGKQMKISPGPQGEIILRITDDPPENNCKPAVDYLFRSAALHFPGRAIAAIMTGMGSDGTIGLRMLKRSGCTAIAQDEASCVVFGMPKEAIHAGVIDTVAPLDGIAELIIRRVREAAL